MKYLLIITLCVISFLSCTKNEGKGGRLSINGNVKKIIVSTKGIKVDTVAGVDRDIFITYGESEYINDDIKSDINGSFHFPFLKKGQYTITAYSDCYNCSEGKKQVKKDISVTKNSESDNVLLYIEKTVDYDDGNNSISGRLLEQFYVGEFPIETPYPSQENEVYIVYGNDEVYFDRMDTGHDGKYEFKNLIKGNYTLYSFSQCKTCTTVLDTSSIKISINSNNEVVVCNDLIIEKR